MSWITIMLPVEGYPYIINHNHTHRNVYKAGKEIENAIGSWIGNISQPKKRMAIINKNELELPWKQVGELIHNVRKNSIVVYISQTQKWKENDNVYVEHWKGHYVKIWGNVVIRLTQNWWNKNKHNYTAIYDSKEAMLKKLLKKV